MTAIHFEPQKTGFTRYNIGSLSLSLQFIYSQRLATDLSNTSANYIIAQNNRFK